MVRCRAINSVGWMELSILENFSRNVKDYKIFTGLGEEDPVLIVINKFNYFILQHMSLRKYLYGYGSFISLYFVSI